MSLRDGVKAMSLGGGVGAHQVPPLASPKVIQKGPQREPKVNLTRCASYEEKEMLQIPRDSEHGHARFVELSHNWK